MQVCCGPQSHIKGQPGPGHMTAGFLDGAAMLLMFGELCPTEATYSLCEWEINVTPSPDPRYHALPPSFLFKFV